MTDNLVASGYDAVYAALPASPTFARLWRAHACGEDFPPGYDHISFLTRAEIGEVRDGLGQGAGAGLVDLACGAGGPGLWLAGNMGARLTGVDLSSAGLTQARRRAEAVGVATASFVAGTFGQLPLAPSSAHGAVSFDALQYAPDKAAAFREIARVLRPGGRLVFTAFEVVEERVAGLPVLGEDPVGDFRPLLEGAGFTVERYEQTPGWKERLLGAYSAVVGATAELEPELGVQALLALTLEMTLTLERDPYRGRVVAVARV